MNNKDLPKFPHLSSYPSIEKQRLFQYTAKDLYSEKVCCDLARNMFSYPEDVFCFYSEVGSLEGRLEENLESFGIKITKSEPYYYLVSTNNGFNHFMRISPEDHLIGADKEKLNDLKSKSKMYYRNALKLSYIKRLDFEKQIFQERHPILFVVTVLLYVKSLHDLLKWLIILITNLFL